MFLITMLQFIYKFSEFFFFFFLKKIAKLQKLFLLIKEGNDFSIIYTKFCSTISLTLVAKYKSMLKKSKFEA